MHGGQAAHTGQRVSFGDRIAMPGHQGHVCPSLCEGLRRRCADTSAGPGYQGCLSRKIHSFTMFP